MFTMYKKILTAVNERLNSVIAARYAMALARAAEAKLYLCSVVEKGQPVSSIEKAADNLKALFIEAGEAGLKAETITETGEPVRKIAEIVRHEAIELVFASTRRADIQRRFYAGSVARRLGLGLPCSVALVRVVHMGRIRPGQILIPLKARVDHIEERAYFSAKLAQAFDSEIFIFHAPKPIAKFFHGEIHMSPVEWEKKLPADIAGFREHMRRYKVMHTGRLVPGRTGRMITIEAVAKKHDLIIMGASERSLISSILRGNPLEEVLRDTPCDLIILKPRLSRENP